MCQKSYSGQKSHRKDRKESPTLIKPGGHPDQDLSGRSSDLLRESPLNTAGSFADFARFAVELLYSGSGHRMTRAGNPEALPEWTHGDGGSDDRSEESGKAPVGPWRSRGRSGPGGFWSKSATTRCGRHGLPGMAQRVPRKRGAAVARVAVRRQMLRLIYCMVIRQKAFRLEGAPTQKEREG